MGCCKYSNPACASIEGPVPMVGGACASTLSGKSAAHRRGAQKRASFATVFIVPQCRTPIREVPLLWRYQPGGTRQPETAPSRLGPSCVPIRTSMLGGWSRLLLRARYGHESSVSTVQRSRSAGANGQKKDSENRAVPKMDCRLASREKSAGSCRVGPVAETCPSQVIRVRPRLFTPTQVLRREDGSLGI